jgi:hypothetical protein
MKARADANTTPRRRKKIATAAGGGAGTRALIFSRREKMDSCYGLRFHFIDLISAESGAGMGLLRLVARFNFLATATGGISRRGRGVRRLLGGGGSLAATQVRPGANEQGHENNSR